MESFAYFQPTEILFGAGRLAEVGRVVARYGKRCLVVTTAQSAFVEPVAARTRAALAEAGVEVAHFDGVVANPTTDCVSAGAVVAKEFGADVVLGLGGGSSMDTAKAIAVEATHPGTCWDYLFFKTPPTPATLPIVAVSTTSGTGSQVTQVAVVTESTTKTKSALYNALLYPRVAIVDPELVVTVPRHVTASTGFDAFTHAFESYLHVGGSPYTDLLAQEAMRLVIENLPRAFDDGADMDARTAMAWADTLAGLCIANAGVTLPHGIGMTIGGQCPQVMHGEALAVTYPEFTRFTWPCAIEKFATVGRIFDPTLATASDEEAAEACCVAIDALLQRVGMWLSLKGLGVTEDDVVAIADHSRVLPDYKNNPRIATRDEIYSMLARSYERA
jgi:alcohol dehydrogenase class IV